ncbi:MAG: hypothetical protein H7039_05235 [Bryobacteraceae bacterium]|nr:hypothetical protein [Bryobacteraceae bacterium]
MKILAIVTLTFAVGSGVPVCAQTVPTGTEITVRTNSNIDAKSSNQGRIYSAVVDRDVLDRSGRVAIPRGSDAELIVRNTANRMVVLDIESVNVNGNHYVVSTRDESVSTSGSGKSGVGKNKRTGAYVGGGAVIGSIIGAIAGGGKGAAIGAATGAGAGAIGQTVTKGGSVRLPAESLVTFRLDRGLGVGSRDNGYTRKGVHYHPNNRRTVNN